MIQWPAVQSHRLVVPMNGSCSNMFQLPRIDPWSPTCANHSLDADHNEEPHRLMDLVFPGDWQSAMTLWSMDIPNKTNTFHRRGLTTYCMAPQCINMCPSSKRAISGWGSSDICLPTGTNPHQPTSSHKSHVFLVNSLGRVTHMQRWCTCLLPSSRPCGAESRWWCSDTPEPPRSRNSP